MAAVFHMYHEDDEAREMREAYNEFYTGDKGIVEEPRVELPTSAGSAMLDLNKAQAAPVPSRQKGPRGWQANKQRASSSQPRGGTGDGPGGRGPLGGPHSKFSKRDEYDVPPLTAEVRDRTRRLSVMIIGHGRPHCCALGLHASWYRLR